jgi:hypothetical protein
MNTAACYVAVSKLDALGITYFVVYAIFFLSLYYS